jgi:hypothetical protein
VKTSLHISALCALFLALVGVGCTGSKQTTTPASTTTAMKTLESLRKSYESTPNLALGGEMKISGIPATIWFDAMIKRQDSMKIILTLPFGMPGGGMSATPKHFIYYDVREAMAIEGTPDRETFSKLMQISMNYDELIALLRGEIPSFPDPETFTAVESNGLIIFTTTGDVTEEITVDPILPAVKSYARKRVTEAPPGQAPTIVTELSIGYDNFKPLGKRYFAQRATVNIMDGEQIINVKVTRSGESLPADASLALDIPAGIERRRM